MSKLQAIYRTISDELDKLNERIKTQLIGSNELMDKIVATQLAAKGKQIRPMIVILCARLFGAVNDQTISAAAAVELLHNATLIHDDVVDDTKLRRNKPTLNSIWDNHIAVLGGDYFVSCAMQQAISTGDIRVIDALCHLGKLLSIGEIDQIYNARYHTITEDAYYEIIGNKTASLFVACARMGCYTAGLYDERAEKLAEFARLLGLCFQIRDDIFDYFTVDATLGKPTGNDLREGKITLPLIHVLLQEDMPDHQAMNELSQAEFLSEDDIARLTAYAIDNGGIEYAYDEMQRLRAKAIRILDEFEPSDSRQALTDIFDYIIERNY